jgi:CubicO group peptidase (beta-lactamase class C family)
MGPQRLERLRGTAWVGLIVLGLSAAGCSDSEEEKPVPRTPEELEQRVRDVLVRTKTPGAGVALVSRDEVFWVAGLGEADRAAGKPVTPETLFRTGSITKSFVALAVLKLQEEGKLGLEDRLRDRAPEIVFTNPWEDSDPVRLVHLLEHTSGLSDLTLSEHAHEDPAITLRDALAFRPQARVVRNKPGRYVAYSNVGPAMAAYAVEKATGQRFEDYVQEEFFTPLGMDSASFFRTARVQRDLAKSYRKDGTTEIPFIHMLTRPSGSVSATPRDVGRLVQLLLNRGKGPGGRLLRPESVARMETPTTTYAARHGLRVGDGLGNYTTIGQGFLFHGHDGAVDGFLSSYGYAPEHGRGYFYSINACNTEAFGDIGHLIRAYLARDWKKSEPPSAAVAPERLQALAGYYEPVSLPNLALIRCVARLLGVVRVSAREGRLRVAELSGRAGDLIPVDAHTFRGEDEPVATAVFFEDDEGGRVLEGVGGLVRRRFRPVPTWRVWAEGSAAVVCLVLMCSAVLFALVWVPRRLLGKLRGAGPLSVRFLPLVAVLCLIGVFLLPGLPGEAARFIEHFGKPTPRSIGLCVLTWLFALSAVAGLIQSLRGPRLGVRRAVWVHALLVSAANVLVAAYLAYWGVIGLRTWA